MFDMVLSTGDIVLYINAHSPAFRPAFLKSASNAFPGRFRWYYEPVKAGCSPSVFVFEGIILVPVL